MKVFKFSIRYDKCGIIFAESYEDAFSRFKQGILYGYIEDEKQIQLEEFNIMEFLTFVWQDCEFDYLK